MTVIHRVTWVDDDWQSLPESDPFHPLFVPLDRQGQGRFDNPHLYATLYCSRTDVAAVGETFANLSRWSAEEISRTKDDRPRCLVQYEIPDTTIFVDLDDPGTLARIAIKPSDVVRRNRDHTQEIASRLWHARSETRASGIEWWSYWRPEWKPLALWSDGLDSPHFPDVVVTDVTPLIPDHPAVSVAADVLPRELDT